MVEGIEFNALYKSILICRPRQHFGQISGKNYARVNEIAMKSFSKKKRKKKLLFGDDFKL